MAQIASAVPTPITPWNAAMYTQLGIQAWTYPGFLAGSSGAAYASAGVLYVAMITPPDPAASITITNILYSVGSAGGTLTASENFVGLYSNTGTLIGTSADQTTNFGATGLKTAALVSGPFTGSWPYLYVGLVFNGTTGPGLIRGYNSTTTINLNATGANLLSGSVGTGNTTLPGSFTPSSLSGATGTPQYPWFGLS